MPIHRLSVSKLVPSLAAAYFASASAEQDRDRRLCLGRWSSKVGELNEVLVLEEASDDAPLHDLYPRPTVDISPAILGRSVCMLQSARGFKGQSAWAKLYEFRTYTLFPGNVERYIQLMLEVLPVREKHSPNVCIWRPTTGNIDQIIHLWAYESLEQRDSLRPAINAEPEWATFAATVTPLIREMKSQLLDPL